MLSSKSSSFGLTAIISLILAFFSIQADAKDPAIAKLFAQQHIEGTMVIASLHEHKTFIYNNPRAKRRFPIASTFKILNSLIALEEQAISGTDEVLKWDGQLYDFPDWNRDQTLATAFKVSCVWCYQELARRVGPEKYRNYLHNLEFGELREPFEATSFWLDGALTISAIEQVEFLKKVYLRTLPFSTKTYETVRQIMQVEQTPHYTLYAKTGWATRSSPQVGWYVGYVETAKDIWFFATNLEIRNKNELPLRQQLTRSALQEKGIIQ